MAVHHRIGHHHRAAFVFVLIASRLWSSDAFRGQIRHSTLLRGSDSVRYRHLPPFRLYI